MPSFKSYDKVERIEKEECQGILKGYCYIFEKIDGANAQIFFDKESGRVACGSRNRVLSIGDNVIGGDFFRGFVKYVHERESLLRANIFNEFPDITIYGEWLVPHKIKYDPKYYNNFYVFDIYDAISEKYFKDSDEKYIDRDSLDRVELYWIPCDCIIQDPEIETLKGILSLPSNFGAPFREGIVVKNYDFVNKWGRNTYGKILHEKFVEVKSKKTNILPTDIEVAIAEQYCTYARVDKICHKIKNTTVPEFIRLEMKHIPQVINMTFYDIITEDMNDILKKYRNPIIDFKKLKNCIFDESKKHFNKFLEEQACEGN